MINQNGIQFSIKMTEVELIGGILAGMLITVGFCLLVVGLEKFWKWRKR